jgi:hypothetical protein
LIAQQTAIRLHIDHCQAVIGILEKEPSHCDARAKNASAADGGGKNDFGHENEDASVAMLRGFARAHLDIKQMLLFALTWIRDALVAGPFASGAARSHFPLLLRARDNSIIRKHRSS